MSDKIIYRIIKQATNHVNLLSYHISILFFMIHDRIILARHTVETPAQKHSSENRINKTQETGYFSLNLWIIYS